MSKFTASASRFGSLSSIGAFAVLACSTLVLAVPSIQRGADMPGCSCNGINCSGTLSCDSCCCCQDISGPLPWPAAVCVSIAPDDCDAPPTGQRCWP